MSEDLAWAAALLDGEGCIRAKSGCISATLGMTDAESVARFHRAAGVGKVGPWCKMGVAGHRPMRYWIVYGREAMLLIERLSPWLGSVKLADYDYAKRMAPRSGVGKGGWQRFRKEQQAA